MLLSPEKLIDDIARDQPLPIELPPLIKAMVKAVAKARPGTEVDAPLLEDTVTKFYLPMHPPRLAMEYLERCGLLFAECSKLRDRIEALQLDIFNLKQSVKSHDAEQLYNRPALRRMWEAEDKRLRAQQSDRTNALNLTKASAADFDSTANQWPLQQAVNFDQIWENAERRVAKNRLHAELFAENAAVVDLAYQINAVAASVERSEDRWKKEDELYTDKIQMLGVGGELALETRLGGALHRYSSLMRDLKEYMFSAEWGLEHVFAAWNETPWELIDDDSYADSNLDVPLDGLGDRLIRLSDAAYGFQLLENAFAVSVKVELSPVAGGQLTGNVRLPLPADTDLAFVRRLRARGPVVRSATVELQRKSPFLTRADRRLPAWLTGDDGTPAMDNLPAWEAAYAKAIETTAAPVLADMASTIALGRLCTAEGDSEGYVTDRTISYTSALGDWTVAVSSPDSQAILEHGLWLDVICSRTRRF